MSRASSCVPFGGDASQGNCCPGLYVVNAGGSQMCACTQAGPNDFGTPCCSGMIDFSTGPGGDYCLNPAAPSCKMYCQEACMNDDNTIDNTCYAACSGSCK